MPLDDEVIFALGRRLVKYKGFILTETSTSVDHCEVVVDPGADRLL